MFVPRATARSALPAAACGLAVSIVWSWGPELADQFGWPELAARFDWSPFPKLTFLLAIAAPWLTTVSLGSVLSQMIEPEENHPGRRYTWLAIVKNR